MNARKKLADYLGSTWDGKSLFTLAATRPDMQLIKPLQMLNIITATDDTPTDVIAVAVSYLTTTSNLIHDNDGYKMGRYTYTAAELPQMLPMDILGEAMQTTYDTPDYIYFKIDAGYKCRYVRLKK